MCMCWARRGGGWQALGMHMFTHACVSVGMFICTCDCMPSSQWCPDGEPRDRSIGQFLLSWEGTPLLDASRTFGATEAHGEGIPQRAEDPLCLLQGAHFPHFQLRGLKRGPRLLSRCPVERFPGCGGPQITPLALQRSGDGATAGGDVTQRL